MLLLAIDTMAFNRRTKSSISVSSKKLQSKSSIFICNIKKKSSNNTSSGDADEQESSSRVKAELYMMVVMLGSVEILDLF